MVWKFDFQKFSETKTFHLFRDGPNWIGFTFHVGFTFQGTEGVITMTGSANGNFIKKESKNGNLSIKHQNTKAALQKHYLTK